MSTTFKTISSFILLLVAHVNLFAQGTLDNYVAQALKNNDGVKQKQFQLEKSMQALNEAKTLFLPSVSLQGDYIKAHGGRTIDLPVGDLMNPAYSTLNQLTHSDKFPTLKNESVQLNPDNYYDVKLHTSMPLVNAEVNYNKQIKKQTISLMQAEINVYKRALVKEVKAAYFRYYQATQAVAIYKDALALVEKNITVNESLLRNGVKNGTALTRAKTEKEKVLAQISQAENNSKNTQAYFNFLLNRNLDTSIEPDINNTPNTDIQQDLKTEGTSVANREELQELAIKTDILSLNKKLQQSFMIPTLSTFLDLGSQGFNWSVNDQSRYYFFGLHMQWDLFAWGQHKYRIKQAQTDVNSAKLEYDETEKAFRLALRQATNDYNSAVSNYNSAKSQRQYAEKYYNDQLKAYKEGQLLYIELIDAQNQLTTAQLQLSLAFANVQIAKAETERDLATYPLN